MPQTVNEVMTADPRTVAPGDTVVEAARQMRDGEHDGKPADRGAATPNR